jgi:hypothetical protein
MAISNEQMERLRHVKMRHETELMRKANVVGVGIGLRRRHGERTDEAAIIVSVTHKVPRAQLDPDDVVPGELEGVPVDIEAVGRLRVFGADED